MPAELRSSSHGQTMVLTLHNPESGNALEPGMYAAGVEAMNAAGDNPEIRSVVLVGDGDTFSTGAQLQRLRDNRHRSPAVQAEASDALHLWIDTISTFPKPIVAAVEGSAIGAGFALVLACDLVVAAHDAVFALAQAATGLSPDGGATWHLTRALPPAVVHEIALIGAPVTAERLYALGMINRLVPPGQALAQALELAQTLNQRAPNVVTATKELLAAAPHASLARQLAAERDQFVTTLHHRNAAIGLDAAHEKRLPTFE